MLGLLFKLLPRLMTFRDVCFVYILINISVHWYWYNLVWAAMTVVILVTILVVDYIFLLECIVYEISINKLLCPRNKWFLALNLDMHSNTHIGLMNIIFQFSFYLLRCWHSGCSFHVVVLQFQHGKTLVLLMLFFQLKLVLSW